MNKKLTFILIFLVALLTIFPVTPSAAQGGQPPSFPPPPSAEELLKFAVPDSTPELNILNPASPLYGKIPPPPPRKVPPTIGNHTTIENQTGLLALHDYWGASIAQQIPAPSDVGVYARQQIITTSRSRITAPFMRLHF